MQCFVMLLLFLRSKIMSIIQSVQDNNNWKYYSCKVEDQRLNSCSIYMQTKFIEIGGSESSEGSTETRENPKQDSHIRSDNNIQHNYNKSHNNTTNSNNSITQMVNEKAIASQKPSQPSPMLEFEVSQDNLLAIKHAFALYLFLAIYEISLQTYTIL